MRDGAGEQERGEHPDVTPGGNTTSARYASRGLLSTFHSPREGQRVAFAFEKLLVYQKAVDMADGVCSRTRDFPRGYL